MILTLKSLEDIAQVVSGELDVDRTSAMLYAHLRIIVVLVFTLLNVTVGIHVVVAVLGEVHRGRLSGRRARRGAEAGLGLDTPS